MGYGTGSENVTRARKHSFHFMPTTGQILLLILAILPFFAGGLLSLARTWWDRESFRIAAKACLWGGVTVSLHRQGEQSRAVRFNNVAGNYFAVMQPRVIAGRGIDANDRPGTPLVCVVSEKFARQFLPGRDPLRETILVIPAFSKEPAKSWEI